MDANEDLARRVAKATVSETFLALGLDVSTPAGVIEAQAGFSLLRSLVKLRAHAITVVVGLAVTGAVYAAWAGFLAQR